MTFVMSEKTLTPFRELNDPYLWKIHLRMLYAKFVWNWSWDSGEEQLFITSVFFYYFVIISYSEKIAAFHLKKKLELLHLGMLCAKVWLKLAKRFWTRGFLKFVNVAPNFKNLNFPHSRMLCVKLGCSWSGSSEVEDEYVKSLKMDDGRQVLWKSSGELKTKAKIDIIRRCYITKCSWRHFKKNCLVRVDHVHGICLCPSRVFHSGS